MKLSFQDCNRSKHHSCQFGTTDNYQAVSDSSTTYQQVTCILPFPRAFYPRFGKSKSHEASGELIEFIIVKNNYVHALARGVSRIAIGSSGQWNS